MLSRISMESDHDPSYTSQPCSPGEDTPLLSGPEDSDNSDGSHPVKQRLKSESRDSLRLELEILTRYCAPLVATYLLQYTYSVITTFVAGHLSADDLAAASIGMTTMNIVGLDIFEGMATALDTLCAHAYGSGHLVQVGLHVQCMLALMALALVPVGAVWIASPWIFGALLTQPELALKAGSFLQVSLLGMPGYAAFEALKRFLQAQGDFTPGLVVLVICTPVNALLSWLFALRLGLGLNGAALGAAVTNDLRPLLLLIYIAFRRSSHACWGGFSREAFRYWRATLKLSLAGTAVNLAEWSAFEIATFSTSYISTRHLAAQTILTTVSDVMWHIPFSVSVAISTRIGHFIGAGLAGAARRVAKLYAVVFVAIGVFDGLLLLLLRRQLPALFTSDPSVQHLAANSMLAVAGAQVVDAIICGCNGTLRGLGRQDVAGWTVFGVNYLAAVPLALWLELGSPHWGLDGVWIGLAAGMAVVGVIECVFMATTRWDACTGEVTSKGYEWRSSRRLSNVSVRPRLDSLRRPSSHRT
ncbi:MATE efflux family protein [Daedalea quercina L-15889]|uniref:MATE efflux family protein n=1 Tax=Daedalea quercina L-15889 TaxID=1314783 RepID=A0A165M818_9APHY|nr:MATE efflux family protein [Daedalea quercina L-15889]